ncbi:MAG: glycosyltransferase [Alphaproteobacteria bacterium]|nr:glycosyltransferase [Alphaproteobacteria bacterium]
MRILLAFHNAYTDSTSGAARATRTLMEWLREAGHECAALGTARFETTPPDDLDAHLSALGVPLNRQPPPERFGKYVKGRGGRGRGRETIGFTLNGVPVTMLMTQHNRQAKPNRLEYEQFFYHFDMACAAMRPDLLITYGGHSVVQEAMRRAQSQGITTLFWLHIQGHEDKRYFKHADYALAPSSYLARHYEKAVEIECADLPPPLHYGEILAPAENRTFVTFVNPAPHKGIALFARLADMLGSARPDIPILVVQSAADATMLNSVPGIDFAKYPQILASPRVPRPADFFELTRILLVPSLFEEPFGMVAAEALINGIPALVSDRGGLPDTVGDAGTVLPLPDWLKLDTNRVVDIEDAQPWFDAVCRLWDDPDAYAAAAKAREVAARLYDEQTLRQRYLDYIEGLCPELYLPSADEEFQDLD